MTETPTLRILLVEDNEWDARVCREAFASSKLAVAIDVARDGVEAMQFLRREPPFADASRPDLVLLDLNLPRKDGREVLNDVKADEELRRIPVIVLTTSKADADVLRAYNTHANAYLNKPLDPIEYGAIVEAIEEFWFLRAVLPGR